MVRRPQGSDESERERVLQEMTLYQVIQGITEVAKSQLSVQTIVPNDIYRLNEMGLRHVIVGKAIYEGRIKLDELKDFILRR